MPSLQTIRTLTVRAQTVGADEATAKLYKLADAQDRVAVVSERTTRTTLSVERAYDRLQREFDATYRAQERLTRVARDLDRAEQQGLATAARRAELMAAAEAKIMASVRANDNLGKSTGAAGQQIQQLGFQLNDIATSLASGSSPFQVLAQQGGQVYQALNGPQGVSAGVQNVAGYVRGLITPATAAGVVLVGAAAGATVAWSRYDDQQKLVESTLAGLGARVGLTARQFNEMAAASAVAGGLSVRQATDLGVAYARTGTLGADNIQRLIGLTKNFAATMGTDVEGAKQQLIGLFSDPAAGIEKLQRQFAFLDGATRSNIESLLRQGRAQEAIKIALDKLPGSLASYNQSLGRISSAWEFVKTKVSDADAAVGGFLNRLLNPAPVEERIKAIVKRLEDLRKLEELPPQPGAPPGRRTGIYVDSAVQGSTMPLPPQRPSEFQTLDRQRQMDEAALRRGLENMAMERLNQELSERAEAVRKIAKELGPVNGEFQKYVDWENALRDAIKSTDPEFKRQINDIKNAGELLDRVSHARRTFLTEEQRAAEQRRIDIANERDVAGTQREAIAARQERLNQAGKLTQATEAEAAASHQAQLVRERETAQMRLMLRDQGLANEALELERRMLFASTEERARAVAELQTEQQLKRQGVDVSGELAQRLIREAGATAQARAELEKYRQIWGEIESAAAGALSSLARDFTSGVDSAQAFTNALKGIADQLTAIGTKSLGKSLTGGLEGLLKGGGLGGFSFDPASLAIGAVGLGLSFLAGQEEQRKAKRQKNIDEFNRQQEEAQRTLEDAQRRQAEATLEAARATARAQEEAARIAEAAARRAESFIDRAFAAGLGDSFQDRLLAQERQFQREREEELRQGGQAYNELLAAQAAERARIIREENDRLIEEERRRYQEARQFLDQFARSIRQFLDGLKAGAQSPLSPADRLAEAQQQYNAQRALAQAGNRDALSGITGYASNLLDAAKAFYASSEGYQNIFATVTRQLENLPRQVTPEELIVNEISKQTASLLTAFDALDLNGDQMISRQEAANTSLAKIFSELDVNGDGQISRLELIKGAAQNTEVYARGTDLSTDYLNAYTSDTNSLIQALQTISNQQLGQLAHLEFIRLRTEKTSNNAARTAHNTMYSANKDTGSSIGLNGDFTYARGGWVNGPGTGTSDSIAARLSNGEFVMRADMARLYGPMLERMNSGLPAIPAMPVPFANDNSAVFAAMVREMQALRAEVAQLRAENARVTAAAAEYEREGTEGVKHAINDLVRETKKKNAA